MRFKTGNAGERRASSYGHSCPLQGFAEVDNYN